jgi:hypothetical protein
MKNSKTGLHFLPQMVLPLNWFSRSVHGGFSQGGLQNQNLDSFCGFYASIKNGVHDD